jgi:hypothetical protein
MIIPNEPPKVRKGNADGRRFLIGVPVAQSASVPFTVVLRRRSQLLQLCWLKLALMVGIALGITP